MEPLNIKRFEPSTDEKSRGMTVKNCSQCRICGSTADRFSEILQCQANPGHIADVRTGLFSDCTPPAPNGAQ